MPKAWCIMVENADGRHYIDTLLTSIYRTSVAIDIYRQAESWLAIYIDRKLDSRCYCDRQNYLTL
jgi:hypothetical protein